jgi:hypothetical protein
MVCGVYGLLYATIHAGGYTLFTVFAKLDRFDMSDRQIGWFLSVPWVVRAFAILVLLPPALRWLEGGVSEGEEGEEGEDGAEGAEGEKEGGEDYIGGERGVDAPGMLDNTRQRGRKRHERALLLVLQASALLAAVLMVGIGTVSTSTGLFVLCTVEGLDAVW